MKETLEARVKTRQQERRLLLDQLSQLDTETGRIKTLLIENQGAVQELNNILATLPDEQEKADEHIPSSK